MNCDQSADVCFVQVVACGFYNIGVERWWVSRFLVGACRKLCVAWFSVTLPVRTQVASDIDRWIELPTRKLEEFDATSDYSRSHVGLPNR